MVESAVYALLCATAVVFAAGFPRGQQTAALFASCALTANWVFCGWTYEPVCPQTLLKAATGVFIPSYIWWEPADFAVALVSFLLGRRHWWGWAMLWLGMCQLVAHQAHEWGVSDAPYLWWLDKLLLAQVAVFLLGGWKGVRDAVSSAVDHLSRLRGVGSRIAPVPQTTEVAP